MMISCQYTIVVGRSNGSTLISSFSSSILTLLLYYYYSNKWSFILIIRSLRYNFEQASSSFSRRKRDGSYYRKIKKMTRSMHSFKIVLELNFYFRSFFSYLKIIKIYIFFVSEEEKEDYMYRTCQAIR